MCLPFYHANILFVCSFSDYANADDGRVCKKDSLDSAINDRSVATLQLQLNTLSRLETMPFLFHLPIHYFQLRFML